MTTPITAPDRSVDHFTGTIADLKEKLTNARYELDDQATLLRRTNELNAGLAKWAEVYQTERDDYREDADHWREIAEGYLATIDELQAELRELRGASE